MANNKKQEYKNIIDVLSNLFELSDETKNEMYSKMFSLNEEEINSMKKYILEYIDKRERNMRDLLQKVKLKKNEIEELIDKQKEKEDLENIEKSI
jgi:hypothetical protein